MYPYIVCGCGNSIGEVYLLFDAMRKKHLREVYGEVADAAMIQVSSDLETELKFALDAVGVRRICCRTKLLTQKQFSDYH